MEKKKGVDEKEKIGDLTIYPVVKDTDLPKGPRELNPILPGTHSMGCFIGPVKSGKSTIVSNLMLRDEFYNDYFDQTWIISPTVFNDQTSRFLREKHHGNCFDYYSDHLIENIISYQESFPMDDRGSYCVVLDDVVGEVRRTAKINSFVTKFRHYSPKGAMVLFCSQKFRALVNSIRVNMTFCMFSRVYNMKERTAILEEMSDIYGPEGVFEDLWDQATAKPYGFLYCKLDVTPPEAYINFETQIFPTNGDTVVRDEDSGSESDSPEEDSQRGPVSSGKKNLKRKN